MATIPVRFQTESVEAFFPVPCMTLRKIDVNVSVRS